MTDGSDDDDGDGSDDGSSEPDDDGGSDDGALWGDPPDVCGDARVTGAERCDDGNARPGDGCESDCTITLGVRTFSVGGAHTCAVSYTGALRCFGDNSFGQLGYGEPGNVGAEQTPETFGRDVAIDGTVQLVTAGVYHTCALTLDGEIYCWGLNDRGQLGYGHTRDLGSGEDETPADLGPVMLGEPAITVAAGLRHTCALMEGGAVKCWGDNTMGQLGIGQDSVETVGAGEEPYPRAIVAPEVEFGNGTTRALGIGSGDHTCLVNDRGQTFCWGAATFGQLGYGDVEPVGMFDTPLEVGEVPLGALAHSVTTGGRHTCARMRTGSLRCWGEGERGQLGYGNTDAIGDDEPPKHDLEFGGLDAYAVTAGGRFSCALLHDGGVRCWGDNHHGQLGNGTTKAVGDEDPPALWPGPVDLGGSATAVEAGKEHVCARGLDAQLRCWGAGKNGRLGSGSTADIGTDPSDFPVRVVPIFAP
jgi:cysteine-rich repeat protein